MCHDPDSFTLERVYANRLQNIDVAAISLGETIGTEKVDGFMKLEASTGCTLDRLPTAKIIQLYGLELNALTRQYIHQDKEHSTLSRAEKNNRDRALCRQAFLSLRREMINLHRRNHTQKGRKIRTTKILVRATDFNKRLIQAFNSDEAKQPEDASDTRDDQLVNDFPESDDDRDEDEIDGGNNTGEDEDNASGNNTNTGQATVEAYLVTFQGFQVLK
ncbi:UPF0157 protein [Colletotrichum sp. SAR11_240]|nr:UPF0157 protein [Colletotrichum sp. SAR11_240]